MLNFLVRAPIDCAASDLIETRSRALESHVWEQNPPPGGTANYRNKMRSFYLNLKAANNPGLREDVVSGEISIVQLYEMDPKVSISILSSIRDGIDSLMGCLGMGSIVTVSRTWRRKSGKPRTASSSPRTCSRRRPPRRSRPRRTRSSAESASSGAACTTRFVRPFLDCVAPLLMCSRAPAMQMQTRSADEPMTVSAPAFVLNSTCDVRMLNRHLRPCRHS